MLSSLETTARVDPTLPWSLPSSGFLQARLPVVSVFFPHQLRAQLLPHQLRASIFESASATHSTSCMPLCLQVRCQTKRCTLVACIMHRHLTLGGILLALSRCAISSGTEDDCCLTSEIKGDPHCTGAHGDKFALRGDNHKIYCLLSAPGVSLGAQFASQICKGCAAPRPHGTPMLTSRRADA